MRASVLCILLAAAFHGGGGGESCAGACVHVGAAAAAIAIDAAEIAASNSNAQTGTADDADPVDPSLGLRSLWAPNGGFHPAPDSVYVPRVDPQAAADTLRAPRTCHSVRNCGQGVLGHGTVCDRATQGSFDADQGGFCREACRTSADCPAPALCLDRLDPVDPNWRGCVPPGG